MNEPIISTSNIHYSQDLLNSLKNIIDNKNEPNLHLQEKVFIDLFKEYNNTINTTQQINLSSCNSYYNQENVKSLQLKAASIYLPKDDEEKPRGDDAHFICAQKNTIGIADGVGGWIKRGVDAGVYARELMANSMITILDQDNYLDPKNILEKAYSMTKAKGSSTACIITLCGNSLHAANVGDSRFLVIRDGSVIFKSEIQQRRFNVPYQLGNCRDDPSVAQEYQVLVQEGDIVVAGTDGLFDNMHDTEILGLLRGDNNMKNGGGLEEDACRIANLALYNSFDRYSKTTPFAVESRKAGLKNRGGKIDDITVVVAYIGDKGED
ncbi:hypothetical protein Leryth_000706 [Lithospermum erythrorhizon]|nr:hypothetical protein Leryth_000706 [Lithospermum erythrorhizon]